LKTDYDINVLYHPSKVNVVENSLHRLSMGNVSNVEDDKELVRDVHRLARLGVGLVDSNRSGCLFRFVLNRLI